jgi:periplasmic copper chaperone A
MNALMRAAWPLAALACLLFVQAACSPPAGKDGVVIVDPWTRATPPGAGAGAGYLTVLNKRATPVRLLGGETAAAERVEVHAMSMDGGVMRMRPLAEGLEIPAGGEVELKPSGMHLMLIGLRRPLFKDETLAMTLVFDGGLRIEVTLPVEGMSGRHGP